MRAFFIGLILVTDLSGCASTSDLMKSSQNHAKARDYYKSIGQPDASKEEDQQAKKDRDNANKLGPLIIDILDHLKKDDTKNK